jgi:hypothetical protein
MSEGWRRLAYRRGSDEDVEIVSNPFQCRQLDRLCRASVQEDQRIFERLQRVLETKAA